MSSYAVLAGISPRHASDRRSTTKPRQSPRIDKLIRRGTSMRGLGAGLIETRDKRQRLVVRRGKLL